MATDLPEADEQIACPRALPVGELHHFLNPPFHIRIAREYYNEYEDLNLAAGEEYYILEKLEITSVVASTTPSSQQDLTIKLPTNYEGKFYPVRNVQTRNMKALTVSDILSSAELPVEVRFSNTEKHGRNFLDNLHMKSDCNFQLTELVTDVYYLGKSVNGEMVLLFPTEIWGLKVLVKKVNEDDVKEIAFEKSDLNYDIFVAHVGIPLIRCAALRDAVHNRAPPRPPKPDTPTGPKPSKPSYPSPASRDDDNSEDDNSDYEQVEDPCTEKSSKSAIVKMKDTLLKIPGTLKKSKATKKRDPLDDSVIDTVSDGNSKKSTPYRGHHRTGDLPNLDQPSSHGVPPQPSTPRLHINILDPSPIEASSSDDSSDGEHEYLKPIRPPEPPPSGRSSKQGASQPTSKFDLPVSESSGHQLSSDTPCQVPLPRQGASKSTSQSGLPVSEPSSNQPPSETPSQGVAHLNATQPSVSTESDKERFQSRSSTIYEITEANLDSDLSKAESQLPGPFSNRSLPAIPIQAVSPRKKSDVATDVPMTSGHQTTGPRGYPPSPVAATQALSHATLDASDIGNQSTPIMGSHHVQPIEHAQSASGGTSNGSQLLDVKDSPPIQVFPSTSELCHQSIEAIGEILKKINIPDSVVHKFREANIDGQIFVDLTDDMLDELGASSLQRLLINKFRNGWRPLIS